MTREQPQELLQAATGLNDGNPFADAVAAELARARSLHAPHHSLHEALAVLWEEFEEVKAEVFRRDADRGAVLLELIQLAAMCQRAAEDCKLLEGGE